MARTTSATRVAAGALSPSLIRWGAVLGGVVVGLSLLILLTLMWFAVAFDNNVGPVATNLPWYLGGSAIVAMLVGGILAGWLSGVPGAGAGFFNGLTVWAIILIASLGLGVPGALNVMDPQMLAADGQGVMAEMGLAGNPIWAAFISLLIGAVAAGLGGVIGGVMTHPAVAPPVMNLPPHEHRDGRIIDLREERALSLGADERAQPVGMAAASRVGPDDARTSDVRADRTERVERTDR